MIPREFAFVGDVHAGTVSILPAPSVSCVGPGLETCGNSCDTDQDCPTGFVCVPSPDGLAFQCALPGQESGEFGES